MLITSLIIFIGSFLVLIYGAEIFLSGAQNMGQRLKLRPFIIGVFILGFGTSLPEFATSIAAIFQKVDDIIIANAVGSSITNMLVGIGIVSILARKLSIAKNLIDIEIPLLLLTTTIFLAVAIDGTVTFFEAVILILVFVNHIVYGISDPKAETEVKERDTITQSWVNSISFLAAGLLLITLGAYYLLEATIDIAKYFEISEAVISITAIAFGTSLPEIVVSIKAVLKGRMEETLGNIFGSSVFNLTALVGIPALFLNLSVDATVMSVGLITLAATTLLVAFSGISKAFHIWDGVLYILIYVLFISNLF